MKSWGKEVAIDLYDCNPNLIRDAGQIVEFTHKLCDIINLNLKNTTMMSDRESNYICPRCDKEYDTSGACGRCGMTLMRKKGEEYAINNFTYFNILVYGKHFS